MDKNITYFVTKRSVISLYYWPDTGDELSMSKVENPKCCFKRWLQVVPLALGVGGRVRPQDKTALLLRKQSRALWMCKNEGIFVDGVKLWLWLPWRVFWSFLWRDFLFPLTNVWARWGRNSGLEGGWRLEKEIGRGKRNPRSMTASWCPRRETPDAGLLLMWLDS